MEREAMIATGNTAEIFLLCDDKVLKLFRTGYSYDAVEREYENHKLISALYENVPRIFELYKNDGRHGYVMERIEGRSLASYMQCEESFKEAMEKFTALHRRLLSVTTDSAMPYKEWMRCVVQGKADSVLLSMIDNLPDGNTLCHGDFHPLNVIVTQAGRPYVIDFANICKAPRQYDIARTYLLLSEAVPEPPIADIYLKQMEVPYEEISRYIDVLRRVRIIEMQF